MGRIIRAVVSRPIMGQLHAWMILKVGTWFVAGHYRSPLFPKPSDECWFFPISGSSKPIWAFAVSDFETPNLSQFVSGIGTAQSQKNETWQFPLSTYWCLVGNGWEWGNGMIIDSYCGSFPHSLLSTSKSNCISTKWNMSNKPTSRIRIPCRGVSQPCSPSSVITTSCWRFPCWAKAASRMLRCYRCPKWPGARHWTNFQQFVRIRSFVSENWSMKEVIVYSCAGFWVLKYHI